MKTFEISPRYILILAAVIAPGVAGSLPAPGSGAKDEERLLVERIRQEDSKGGPYSDSLIAPLTELGLLYQERGDDAAAAAAIGRALQVVRANYGLYSLEQAPLIRQSISNEEERGNRAAVQDLDQQLLALAKRHPDDLRTIPILREHADRQMTALRRHRVIGPTLQLAFGSYGESADPNFGNRAYTELSALWDAQQSYTDAIGIMLRHQLYTSDELRELEMEVVRSSYLFGGNYQLGRQSLRRLIAYDVANSEPWLTRIDALVQMADWDLLFRQNGLAFDTYEEAYAELKLKGIPRESIDAIFSPKIPITLPTFMPNPLESEETPRSTGYIDVAFEIGKYGNARQVDVLDTTTNAARAAKERLVHQIMRSRFRSRVTGDKLGATPPIVVRYFLNE